MKNRRLKEIKDRLKQFFLADDLKEKSDVNPVEESAGSKKRVDVHYTSIEVLNSVPDGVVGINEKNEIVVFNTKSETIFGYSEEELIGKPLEVLIPPSYADTHHRYTRKYMAKPLSKPMGDRSKDMFGLRKNGEVFPVNVSLSYIKTPNGKIALAAIRDITDQIKIETELKESTKQFKDLFELSPDAIFIHDFETITHVNRACLDLLGYDSIKEVVGKPVTKTIVFHEDYHIIEGARNQLKDDKTVFLPQVRHLKKDGTFVLTESHVSNISFQGVPHLQVISRDITKRKELEKKIAKNTRLLIEAERLSNLGSWDWDIKSNVITWSDEACRIYGVDKDTFTPTYELWLKTLHPDDKEQVLEKIATLYKDEKEINFEYRIIRPNGEIRHVQSWNLMEFDKAGCPKRMTGATLDVTEITIQKKALQNLATNFGAIRGNEFFNRVSSYLANTLNIDYAFVGKLIEGNRIEVIGGVGKGEIIASMEYFLSGTPCANVMKQEVCLYNSGVQELFPEDQLLIDMNIAGYVGCPLVDTEGNSIGIIVLLNEQPIVNSEIAASTLQIFSERTSAEIQRLESETKLANSEDRLSIINNNSPDLIYTIDHELKITYANRGVKGVSPQDALGRNVLDFIPETFLSEYKKHLKAAFDGEKQEFEFRANNNLEKEVWHSIRMSMINNDRKFSKLLIVITDITERKKVEIQNGIINSISNKLSSNISVDDFCRFIFSELQKLKPFHDIYISSYDEVKDEISIFFQVETNIIKNDFPEPRVGGNGLFEYIVRTKKGLLLNESELSSFHKKNNLKVYGLASKSWIGVPLISDNNVIGVLAAECFQHGSFFTETDLNLLSFIGTQIGTLIEKVRADKEITQFEKYFSISMDLLCIAGIHGFFKKINPKFSEILGYTEEELLTKTFIEFVHPSDVDATYAEIEKLSLGIKTIDFINRYRCKNGTYKWFMWSSASDPKTKDIYAAAKEVTEQMKSREILAALAEIQDSFITESTPKDSFERMLDVLLEVTESEYGFIGEVLYEDNEPYLKTHAITNISWDRETAKFYEKNSPSGLEFKNMKTLFGHVITKGEPVISNAPHIDPRRGGLPPGHPHMGSFMGMPFYNGKELIGMVGIANKPNGYNDKDAEQLTPFLATCATLLKAYQNSEKKYEAEKEVSKLADIVSYSSDAIISTNQDGIVVSWNSGAEKLLGYTAEEIIGTSVAKLGPKELRQRHVQIIQEVRSGKSIESYETLQLKKGNVSTHVNMSIFPLIDEKGQVKGISSILRDISEQKDAQKIKEEFTKNLEIKVQERTQDLEQAQKKLSLSLEKEKELGELKSRFVSTASHQFRTPLSVIQASIGILDMQKSEMSGQFKASFEQVYDRIKGQIKRMTNLMDEVLILGKIDAGNIKPIFELTDLVGLCREIATSYNEIQEDGRKVDFVVKGNPEMISIDAKLMEHAISNLISNAFKYSIGEPDPSAIIYFEEKDIKISIKDQGIGVPEEDLKHLFEPFYRATNSADFSGTGLGSAIAKEYVELNGGTIAVKSEQNLGSEFIITLKK